ncbi:MAG TPA: O-antigen ligase family protein [Verrucomicrobiae bacterium]
MSAAIKYYALAFGLFLGLCIWKFGDPVILDTKIIPPESLSDFWHDPWPTHWANWFFIPFAIIGAILVLKGPLRWPASKWLWLLPLGWLGWQFLSATQTVDTDLTATTLWQFFGCVACYFLGAFLFANPRLLNFLMIGILAGFTYCLIRAVDQRFFDFPQTRHVLVEGQQAGWTNIPPETLLEMKQESMIITTNDVDVANPVWLDKFSKARAMGTLVYPNALAGIVLLLFPAALTLAFGAKLLRPAVRALVIALAILLGSAGLFFSGSKFGWLLAMGVGGLYLLRLDWPMKMKLMAISAVLVLGLGIFAVRFHHYFANGATSVGARFDYWHAAVQTTAGQPLFGTGPGTFQRPYARLKSPDAEMARLTHNDYLEQFSDSGVCGGIIYAAWIFLALIGLGRRIRNSPDPIAFAIFAGLLAWFIQGFGEFSLYIPALAWTAFMFLGLMLGPGSLEPNSLAAQQHRPAMTK